MDLDQFIYVTEKKNVKDGGIDLIDDGAISSGKEFFEWRKHWDLHGYMEWVYRAKGGKEPATFDLVEVNEEDIDQLKHALEKNELPYERGFF